MKLALQQKLFLFFGLFAIFFSAWMMQSQFLIKGDVAWLIHLSRLMYQGKSYGKTFFEINPPLCILIYTPVIAIQKLLPVSAIIAVRLYVFICSSVSLVVCYSLLKKIIKAKDFFLMMIFLFSLAFVYLILPLNEFGQRENFLVFLTMPYFLLMSCRLENKAVNSFLAVFVGLLAGIGFSIKPFFLAPFFLIVLYRIFYNFKLKNYDSLFSVESIVVVAFCFFYLAGSFIFFRSYFTIMIPLALKTYYQGVGKSWLSVFFVSLMFFSMISFILYAIQYKKNNYKVLCTVLIFALTGFLVSYIVQKLPWYYHFLPAFSIALLLDVFLFGLYIQRVNEQHSDKLIAFAFGVLLFIYPCFYIADYYHSATLQKTDMEPLIHYLHRNALHKPVYFLSAYTAYMISVFEEAGTYPASRLTYLGWMRDDYKKNFLEIENQEKEKSIGFFVNIISDDLNQQNPELVFVDTLCIKSDSLSCIKIPYLQILTKNKNFKAAWQSYSFLKTMKKKGVYAFDIYKRD